ncbi:2,3-diketo-5-methylthio-1-phosphopentane phosphatase family [Corchorus olitorius]|uniref:2,3-diketo-5-methylthio-1-phosphopentane phosphatase family n=1 Tax=Corchorus olitorius TaxID=93759 RepID=A0A1R3L413_9ROSI|nr:2,3-diketo-5-methylthio-1-phosphopentane phosphatase family [Corchorus olitorius]
MSSLMGISFQCTTKVPEKAVFQLAPLFLHHKKSAPHSCNLCRTNLAKSSLAILFCLAIMAVFRGCMRSSQQRGCGRCY